MEDCRIVAYRDSDQHSKVVEFIDNVVLRGLDPAVPNNTIFELLNKFTEAENSNQVINTIALATGLISFDDLEGNEDSLETGNVNLTVAKFKRNLETLVAQLPVGDSPPYRFVLIAIALGTQPNENAWETNFSFVIKTQSRAGDNCYIDMTGRVYPSFQKFLKENKFPLAVLCYPSDGAIELDDQNHVKLSYAVVGEAQILKDKMDTYVAIISATFIPNVSGMVCCAAYKLFRAGMELVDCYKHETLHPLKFPHTIGYWAEVVMCLGYLIIRGMQVFKSLPDSGVVVAGLMEITLGGAGVGFAALDLMTQADGWSKMMLKERTKLSFVLCFVNRLAPSLENGVGELECMRFQILCSTFEKYVAGNFNIQDFKKLVLNMSRSSVQSTVAALLFLVKKLIEKNVSIELSEDFVTMKIGERTLMFRNVLKLTSDEIRRLGESIETLNGDLSELPSMLDALFGYTITSRLLAS